LKAPKCGHCKTRNATTERWATGANNVSGWLTFKGVTVCKQCFLKDNNPLNLAQFLINENKEALDDLSDLDEDKDGKGRLLTRASKGLKKVRKETREKLNGTQKQNH